LWSVLIQELLLKTWKCLLAVAAGRLAKVKRFAPEVHPRHLPRLHSGVRGAGPPQAGVPRALQKPFLSRPQERI
jgi:hypothetical protein